MTVKNQLDDIADFIRETYSMHGVEIGAQGARSITVRLPEDLPLTALCADLWNNFEAPVDLKPGPVLTVWACERNKEDFKTVHLSNQHTTSNSNSAVKLVTYFGMWTCSVLAAAILNPYLLESAAYKWAVHTVANISST